MFAREKIIVSRSVILALLYLMLTAFQTNAAVTVDTTSSGGAADNLGLSQLTWSHTTGSGASRALFVGVSTSTTSLPGSLPTNRVVSVTYGSQTLERVGTQLSPNLQNSVEMFRLVAPASGTNTITVTFAVLPPLPNLFVNQAVGGAISLTGVNQTTPNRNFFSSSGASATASVAVTDSIAGDLVLDTLGVSPTAGFVAPDIAQQTERWNGRPFFFNSYDVGAGSTEPAMSSVTTTSWMLTTSDNWALGATAIVPVPATAASVTLGGRVLTSSGRGVSKASVRLTDSNGNMRTVLTNPFGYYRFENVGAGETYVFNIFSKRYIFAPQVISVMEENNGLNFTAEPFRGK